MAEGKVYQPSKFRFRRYTDNIQVSTEHGELGSRPSSSNTLEEYAQQCGVAGRVKDGGRECSYGWRVRPSAGSRTTLATAYITQCYKTSENTEEYIFTMGVTVRTALERRR